LSPPAYRSTVKIQRESGDPFAVAGHLPALAPVTKTRILGRTRSRSAKSRWDLDRLNKAAGWSAFAKAGAKFNKQFITTTAKGGVRYTWVML
jgi:hypothetical protein